MDNRIERLLEAAREVGISRDDVGDCYEIYLYVGTNAAVDMMGTCLMQSGFSAPTLNDLEDDDFVAQYVDDHS